MTDHEISFPIFAIGCNILLNIVKPVGVIT